MIPSSSSARYRPQVLSSNSGLIQSAGGKGGGGDGGGGGGFLRFRVTPAGFPSARVTVGDTVRWIRQGVCDASASTSAPRRPSRTPTETSAAAANTALSCPNVTVSPFS